MQSSTPKLLFHFTHSFSFLSRSSSLALSLPLIRFRSFTARAAPAAIDLPDKRGNGDTFFPQETVSWNSVGLSERLSQALSHTGFDRPSLIQAACIPTVLSGKDVIIAAETGSGKTHGYLAPLVDKLCSDPVHFSSSLLERSVNPSVSICLVLCPNVLLCEQVARMANDLSVDDGKPLLRAATVCGNQGWPVNEPDIVVSTPAALLNNLDPKRRRRTDFIRSVKCVVFDEADMLLCGSFQNQVIRLINMLRFDEKLLSQVKESGSENAVEVVPDELLHSDMEENDRNGNLSEEVSEDEVDVDRDGTAVAKDWRRVRRNYKRSKQYVFVAATLPVNGKKTAGAMLKKMFPDATWVCGNYLHQHNPRLKQKWIEVTVDTQVDALIDAVKQFAVMGLDDGSEASRTMVFANTVDAVEAVAKILERAGIECFRFHKDLSLDERAEALLNFKEKGGTFVCTDAAARGIDIPNVSHVIQADFATSAVDFLHRVGRTARGGHYGVVTSLYTESNKELVSAIREAGKLGQPVETAFSRKRSFRNKLKKRGTLKAVNVSAAALAMT